MASPEKASGKPDLWAYWLLTLTLGVWLLIGLIAGILSGWVEF